MRKITIAILALTLSGCAGMPAPKVSEQKAPVVKHSTKTIPKLAPAVVQPAPAKPQTFKQRWFDRFMKHKTK